MIRQHSCYALDLATRESIVLAEVDGTTGTVQIEYGFVSPANHVNVGGPMIVRVDDNPKSVESEDRRHTLIVSNFLTAWVLSLCPAFRFASNSRTSAKT
jgi:hypothetical protein